MRTFALGTRQRRPAFTIIELMVALALVLFIMSIIAQVFGDASEAFRSQRAKAELSEKLRFLTQSIRADLRSRHFERGRRLSDPNFWQEGPPKSGYFRLEQQGFQTGSTSSALDNFPVGTPNENHVMAFTSFLSGKTQGSFHSCLLDLLPGFMNWKNGVGFPVPPLSLGDTRFEETTSTYNSPDAEVAWFLGPSTDFTEYAMQDEPLAPSPGSVKLYKLYRRTWLMLPEEPAPLPAPQISSIGQPAVQLAQRISVVPGLNPPQLNIQTTAQSPSVDVPMRRAIGAYMPGLGAAVGTWKTAGFDSTSAALGGSDYLVADNVLSFTVEVLREGDAQFKPLHKAIPNPSFAPKAVYDSWCGRNTEGFSNWNFAGDSHQIPMMPPGFPSNQSFSPISIVAIRVTIRLYDTNNALSPSKTTWQATVVEPL